MNSSERSQPLRDPQQITFIMLNRFWALSKKSNTSPSPHMVFLMHNIKLDGMPTKIKLKIQACFTLYFKFWEGTSVKCFQIQATSSFISCFTSAFISADIIFYNFLELHSTLSEKDFCRKFSFFNGFTETPHHFNTQNLLSVTNAFLLIFPKMPSEFF